MGWLIRGCGGAAAALCVLLALAARGDAALPAAGARFEIHDHRTSGAGWHVELDVSGRDRALLRAVVLYDERCDETVAAEHVALTPDGTVDSTGSFAATSPDGHEQSGTWELHVRFVTPHRVEGSFRLAEPGCTADHDFVGEHGGHHAHSHLVAGNDLEFPDLAAAGKTNRLRARRLLHASLRSAHRFDTVREARRLGYRFNATPARPGFTHMRKYGARFWGRLLDADAPQALFFWCPSRGRCRLAVYMYRAPGGKPPSTWGNILSWHRHGTRRSDTWMMHVWLLSRVRIAYATCAPFQALAAELKIGREPYNPEENHGDLPCNSEPALPAARKRTTG